MTFHFRPAVREDSMPLIALYSQSGCGKTFSALLLARGIVGDEGKIAMIDTESGRGSLYSDQIPGGYDTLKLTEPFSPQRYIEAIQAAEAAGYDIVVLDSVSHEWEGIGGVIDMATDIEETSGKKGLHCWNKPKQQHNKFVLKLLGSNVPVVLCIRAKYKTRQRGRDVVKDDHVSPIQAEDFIFEMTLHAEVLPNHSIRLTKCSHPDLRGCFEEGSPITIHTGARLAEWAKGGIKQRPAIEVLEEARFAAREGKAKFDAWWKQASKADRTHARTVLEELKKLCDEHDNPDADDDPFAGMESPQQQATPMDDEALDAYLSMILAADTIQTIEGIESMHRERFKATPDSSKLMGVLDALDAKRAELSPLD